MMMMKKRTKLQRPCRRLAADCYHCWHCSTKADENTMIHGSTFSRKRGHTTTTASLNSTQCAPLDSTGHYIHMCSNFITRQLFKDSYWHSFLRFWLYACNLGFYFHAFQVVAVCRTTLINEYVCMCWHLMSTSMSNFYMTTLSICSFWSGSSTSQVGCNIILTAWCDLDWSICTIYWIRQVIPNIYNTCRTKCLRKSKWKEWLTSL